MKTVILQLRCPNCRCEVLAEVHHVGHARRCQCPWCDRRLRIPTKPKAVA